MPVSTDPIAAAAAAGATRVLARHIAASRFEALPANVVREAIRSLVNWTGCAIGGANHESVDIALASLGPFAKHAPVAIHLDRQPKSPRDRPYRCVPWEGGGDEDRNDEDERIADRDVFRLVTQHHRTRPPIERQSPFRNDDARPRHADHGRTDVR